MRNEFFSLLETAMCAFMQHMKILTEFRQKKIYTKTIDVI